jgi:hypothetical protein
MTRHATIVAAGVVAVCSLLAAPASAQSPEAKRIATRERLGTLLTTEGPKYNITFRRSQTAEFNFVGNTPKYANTDYFEVVLTVTDNDVIKLSAYPHYKGAYINVDKVKNSPGLARQLLNLNFHNFLHWGVDDTYDIYGGYTITLESGFPTESIGVVLDSIKLLDQYVGRMRPNIDGTAAATDAASGSTNAPGTTADRPNVSGGFTTPPGARAEAEFLNGRASVSYDASKWKETTSTDPGRRNFTHSTGDGYASIIYERIEIPTEQLRVIALDNARKVAPDARIVEDTRRRVNGTDVMLLRMEGTTSGIRFTYLGYYWAGTSGTVQVITWTGQNLFSEYRGEFENFLNGFHLK